MKLIDKDALVAEIDRRIIDAPINNIGHQRVWAYNDVKDILDTLEVKEVDLDIEKRIKECPFRQVACNRYEDTPVICDGRCSWVADYPKLKELKSQKVE